jgi:hypothetical protein
VHGFIRRPRGTEPHNARSLRGEPTIPAFSRISRENTCARSRSFEFWSRPPASPRPPCSDLSRRQRPPRVTASATPASSATDYNSNNAGSIFDFAGSVTDYGATQPTCYEFKGVGTGQGNAQRTTRRVSCSAGSLLRRDAAHAPAARDHINRTVPAPATPGRVDSLPHPSFAGCMPPPDRAGPSRSRRYRKDRA